MSDDFEHESDYFPELNVNILQRPSIIICLPSFKLDLVLYL